MEITLTRNDSPRKSLMAVFGVDGRPGSVHFSKTLFTNQEAPKTLTISDIAFAAPKLRETPEERKARIKALPKLTTAERVAKMEQRLAKLKLEAAKNAAPKDAVPKDAAPRDAAAAQKTTQRPGRR